MLRNIVSFLLLLPVISLAAKEKCKIIITAPEGVRPYELVIEKKGVDPKNSTLRTTLENGVYECEVETDEIEMQSVLDFGEIIEKGHTSRTVDFFVEDGATVNIYFDGDMLTADSDGSEFIRYKQMKRLEEEWRKQCLSGMDPDNLTDEQQKTISAEYVKWRLDYYKQNPMLAFLLDLTSRLSSFRFTDTQIKPLLDTYHQYYESLYPEHKSHAEIAAAEKSGLQIVGLKYNDFTAFHGDGTEVKASDLYAGKPTLVICWATWCLPCRKEAKELIPIYEKYQSRGLNAFSIAREFQSADKFNAAVAEDNYPWVCLLDLDDKYRIFDNHGATSSALFLIDSDGTIAAAGYEWKDIEDTLNRILPD